MQSKVKIKELQDELLKAIKKFDKEILLLEQAIWTELASKVDGYEN